MQQPPRQSERFAGSDDRDPHTRTNVEGGMSARTERREGREHRTFHGDRAKFDAPQAFNFNGIVVEGEAKSGTIPARRYKLRCLRHWGLLLKTGGGAAQSAAHKTPRTRKQALQTNGDGEREKSRGVGTRRLEETRRRWGATRALRAENYEKEGNASDRTRGRRQGGTDREMTSRQRRAHNAPDDKRRRPRNARARKCRVGVEKVLKMTNTAAAIGRTARRR